ncbi:MAG: alpha/beta fold hydrolase [Hyphomicrobiales bacterium]|nr:alpha/beta fold hydrolase [Hyphomicrobiales bacterium]
MVDRLVWEKNGRGWPNGYASRFVEAAGFRWHVQVMGQGPALLLAHGTGASTHSWRDLAPLLARHFTVIAPDLPGHGFTDAPPANGLTLPGMARSLGELLRAMNVSPAIAAGHSAGAAILARMCLDGAIMPDAVISLNGALMPFRGVASKVFSPMAKLLFINPFIPRIFAWRAGGVSSVERLIESTGSAIDADGVELYARLFRSPAHVAGALGMMANWDLTPLVRDLPKLKTPFILVAGGADKAIPADDAFRVRNMVKTATVEYLRGLGHLAHEEQPEQIAEIITRVARSFGALNGDIPRRASL